MVVLNAFRHQRMDHFQPHISKAHTMLVLNAFRHQRMDHWPNTLVFQGIATVLNAFRHQRMDHTTTRVSGSSCFVCSTPFGINEWIT